MRALTRELAREALGKPQAVEIPALDMVAYVRPIATAVMLTFAEMSDDEASPILVGHSLCGEDGALMFPEVGPMEIEEIKAWPASLFRPLLDAAMSVNGLGDDHAVGN